MPQPVPPAPEFGEAVAPRACPEALALLARRRSASPQHLAAPAPEGAELDDLLRLSARVPDHGKMTPWRFVLLRGAGKARFVEALRPLAASEANPAKALASLGKLEAPPLAVAVVSAPREGGKPVGEQRASAHAVCTQMLIAAAAMGYGANWITDWYGERPDALRLLGLALDAPVPEQVAGWILLGTAVEPPLERARPDLSRLVAEWNG